MHERPHVTRTLDIITAGLDDRRIRHAATHGHLARIAPGLYVGAGEWKKLTETEQSALRIVSRMQRMSPHHVASHFSAAALWGLPIRGPRPIQLQTIDPRRATYDSTPSLCRRPGPIDPADETILRGIRVTTAARTAVDLALILGFIDALILFDGGLHLALFTRADLAEQLERRPRARRIRAVRRALELAAPEPESAAESLSRAQFALLGVVQPRLQEPFEDARGRFAVTDFFWADVGVVGEVDGAIKYLDAAYRGGRSAEQVVLDEKLRAERLEALPRVERVVRWNWGIASSRAELGRRLERYGVPRVMPVSRRASGG